MAETFNVEGLKKKCSCCGEIKPLSEFNRNAKSKDGYQYYCRECQVSTRHSRKSDMVVPKVAVEVKNEKINTLIRDYTPRELMCALKAQGYTWTDMTISIKVNYDSI